MNSEKTNIIKIVLFLFLSTMVSCNPFNGNFDDTEDAVTRKSKNIIAPTSSENLKVMTWNVKFGGGRIDFFFDCYGDRVLMTKDEVISNLEGLAKLIKEENPDILFVQEIDISSKRTAYVDQLQWLLNNTDLNYGVYGSQWKNDYVLSDGIGKVDSGSAILSKYKLKNGKRFALPLIGEQDGVTQYFYLKRNILSAEITFNNKEITLLTTHTSAYSNDGTKLKQIKILEDKLAELDKAGKPFIAGGDFNTIPPFSEKLSDFSDSICTDEDFQADDYSEETEILSGYYEKYQSAIPLEAYKLDNSKYFTHTTNKDGFWNRKLDFIFTNRFFNSGRTIQENTMSLSDHAPSTVNFTLTE